MGMSADEYWDGDVWLAKAYRDAWKIKEENNNISQWLNGYYVYQAFGTVLDQAFGGRSKYPDPIELYPREKTAEEIQEEYFQRLTAWGEQFNEQHKN